MSFVLHGVGVSSGIAIGHAYLASHAALEVAHHIVPEDQVSNEISRLDIAFNGVREELEALNASVVNGPAAPEYGAFLELHRMILDDPTSPLLLKLILPRTSAMPSGLLPSKWVY